MIPLGQQELLRQRLQSDLSSRVRIDYFTQRPSPIYVAGREECALCAEGQALFEEIASLSDRISLSVHDFEAERAQAAALDVDKLPATVIRGGSNRALRFFGLPSGSVFPALVETMIDAGRVGVTLQPETVKQLRKLKSTIHVQVLVSPACGYSPALAHTAFKLGLQSARLAVDVVEAGEFPALVRRHGVSVTPTTIVGDGLVLPGSLDEPTLLRHILSVAEGRPISAAALKAGAATALPLPSSGSGRSRARPAGSSGLILPPR